jgi:hypothetical protein
MRLVQAMTLRDGGTTSITIRKGFFSTESFTIDYALPWNGRPRYVFRGPPFGKKDENKIEMNGPEEQALLRPLKNLLQGKFGVNHVQNFLAGNIENPGKGKWFYAFNFLWIAHFERRSD